MIDHSQASASIAGQPVGPNTTSPQAQAARLEAELAEAKTRDAKDEPDESIGGLPATPTVDEVKTYALANGWDDDDAEWLVKEFRAASRLAPDHLRRLSSGSLRR